MGWQREPISGLRPLRRPTPIHTGPAVCGVRLRPLLCRKQPLEAGSRPCGRSAGRLLPLVRAQGPSGRGVREVLGILNHRELQNRKGTGDPVIQDLPFADKATHSGEVTEEPGPHPRRWQKGDQHSANLLPLSVCPTFSRAVASPSGWVLHCFFGLRLVLEVLETHVL